MTNEKVSKRAKKATQKAETPLKSTRKVESWDLVEVDETSLILAVDLKRQSDELLSQASIEPGQKLFPYGIMSRLMVGWQQVSYISSVDVRISADHPLPQMTVRFLEKMAPEAIPEMDPNLRAEVEAQIALLRQYPFISVESPLLTP